MEELERIRSKRLSKFTLAIAIGVGVITLAIGMLAISKLYGNIQYEIYDERAFHLRETAISTREKIEVLLNNRWNSLDQVTNYLDLEIHTDNKDISQILDDTCNMLMLDDCTLFFVDSKGTYYSNTLENGKAHWTNQDYLINDKHHQILLISQTLNGISDVESMVFLTKPDKEFLLEEDTTITHIGLMVDMALFQEQFRSKVYENQNQTLILDSNGARVYYDVSGVTFNTYNVLRTIAEDEVVYGGDMEEVIASYNARQTGTAEFTHEGVNYFMAYTPLMDEWMYLTLVPEEYVSANTVGFTSAIANSYLVIGIVIFIFFVMFMVVIVYSIGRNRQVHFEHEANERLVRANEAARAAEAQAKDASRAKSEFLSNMSHDIRTPINGIVGMITIAKSHPGEADKLMEYIEKIEGATDHLLHLINDVLDMSKAESGKVTLTREAMNIVESLNNCADMERSQASEKNIDIECNFENIEHKYLYGSPLHLRQILLNLLSNAVKYTNANGHIRFTARELYADDENATMEIVVEDNGIGMSKEFLKHIFDPFSQEMHSARSEYKGTGLGMSITKNLVDIMGGTITVESTKDVGSKFIVKITFEIDDHPEIIEEEAHSQIKDITGLKILLAEDNELNMEIATTILEDKGAIVTTAENGLIAFNKFKESTPYSFDVILMDIMMPEMDGYTAAREIRKLKRPDAGYIPIIAMTANAFAEDVAKSKEAGMDAHIAKPLNMENFIRTLSRYRGRVSEN